MTDGVGYIGSHTCMELLTAGYDVVVVDNLYNPSEKALERMEKTTGRKVRFCEADLLDRPALKEAFDKEDIDSVIHFAGLKAMGEFVCRPLEYYRNNITGTLILRDEIRNHGVKNIVFSSSAAAYGDPAKIPITENYPKGKIISSHGRTKGMLGQILADLHTADLEWNVVLLYYFSPTGTHESGLIGEDPKGIPSSLAPYIVQTAVDKLNHLNVFDDDYNTPDGTGVKDYIHVVDLVKGRVKAVQKPQDKGGASICNLGTGMSYGILDVLHVYGRTCSRALKYEIQPRREGDMATCYSDSAKAKRELGWVAEKGIEEMCANPWKRQSISPNGYRD